MLSTWHGTCLIVGSSKHGLYGDAVEETDWAVGQIMMTLQDLHYMDNTLVYFSSDHGANKQQTDDLGQPAGGWNGNFRGECTILSVECIEPILLTDHTFIPNKYPKQ